MQAVPVGTACKKSALACTIQEPVKKKKPCMTYIEPQLNTHGYAQMNVSFVLFHTFSSFFTHKNVYPTHHCHLLMNKALDDIGDTDYYAKNTMDDIVFCRELDTEIPVLYDTGATMSFINPKLWKQYANLIQKGKKTFQVATAKGFFAIRDYIPLTLVNASGEAVPVHFYCAPSLPPQVKFLLSNHDTYAMGFQLRPRPDVHIEHSPLHDIQALNQTE